MSQTSFTNIFFDMFHMHDRYEVHDAVDNMDAKQLKQFLKFRLDFLDEELGETWKAYDENDPEEIVDGLIDLIVIAAGTLDLFGVDAQRAWDEVLRANLSKEVGIKESRPNPLGLPDLVKPEGWKGPDHADNHGRLAELD
jgi:predicted HAD superfamily Cof-like phosphohydrolase